MKAVILDIASLGEQVNLDSLRKAAPSLTEYDNTAPGQVAERIGDHAIAVVNKARITADAMRQCPNLKLIAVTATGINNIDVTAARELGIQVANVTHYSTGSLVQHTFSLILALTTRLIDYNNDVRDGRWAKSENFCLMDHPIRELAGKTLGIVGSGDLGAAVATVGKAFGMHVLIAARPNTPYSPEEYLSRTPFYDLLPKVDVLSLHCLLSADTREMIGERELRLMKPDALLINTARGGLIHEQALADALRERRIGGAGLDVLSEEPPVNPNPLLAHDLPNLIITPHCAWASREARQRLIDKTALNIRYFLSLQHPV